MKKLLINLTILVTLIILPTKVNAYMNTEEDILNTVNFRDRIELEYVDTFKRPTIYGTCLTKFYDTGNKYTISLKRLPFDNRQKERLFHELFHAISHEYKININAYMRFVHRHENYEGYGFKYSKSECFAEDGKVYLMNKFYGIKVKNNTKYTYNWKFDWFIKRMGIKIGE